MISIVTSLYNQIEMNRLYYESIVKNTKVDFELIIVDNNSNDGSREFFEGKDNVTVITNDGNYNYPYCQNKGIEVAKYDIIAFLNNDIILTNNWDERLLEVFKNNKIKVLSVSTNDHLETKKTHFKINNKWKRIKKPIQFLFGNSSFSLKLMTNLMYGDLNKFSDNRFQKWGTKTIEGYSGSAIIMKKEAIDLFGLWDERIQASDFDLFNKVKEYSISNKEVLPIQLALGIYFHHYQRLTVKVKYPPFVNKDIMISIDDKWGDKTKILRKDIIG